MVEHIEFVIDLKCRTILAVTVTLSYHGAGECRAVKVSSEF